MQELSIYSDIFTDESAAYEYLLSLNKFNLQANCSRCGSGTRLTIDSNYQTGRYLRCSRSDCRKKDNSTANTFFSKPKIELHEILSIFMDSA